MLTWWLQGFDPSTEQLVQETHLTRLTVAAIRAVLNVDDDIPVECFDFDIPNLAAVRALAAYADECAAIDETLIYQLGCYESP
jgi:hypothetical protein